MQKLGELGDGNTFFRTHNLLTTGDSSQGLVGVPGLKFGSTNAYTEDANGNPIYNWTIVDQILDSYLENDVRPYLQVGFMPEALATNPDPYFFEFNPSSGPSTIYTGWSHTPTSYEKWEELTYQWTSHNVDRYGEDEVNKWWFEIWNEPNIAYWNGTREEFYQLHDHAVNGVKRAAPSARVGGAEVAGGIGDDNWLGDFFDHCLNGTNYATGETGTPLDFMSFHAKGAPTYINNTDAQYIQMNVSTQLDQIDKAFALIAQYPELKDKPIVLGEYDPDGCAACTSAAYEYRNSPFYSAYTAASFIRALDLAVTNGVNLRGILTWAFEYEPTKSNPNETVLYDGYRVLSTQGLDKAVLNVHRMLSMMSGGERIKATSDAQIPMDVVLSQGIRNESDVGAFASMGEDGKTVYVFIWHYHDQELDWPDADISLCVSNLPSCITDNGAGGGSGIDVAEYRLDDTHGSAFTTWQGMGSPQPPSEDQYKQLEQAAALNASTPGDVWVDDNGDLKVNMQLAIRGSSLLVITAKNDGQ